MRSLIAVIVALVWLFLGYFYHQEQMKCCSQNGITSKTKVKDNSGQLDAKSTSTELSKSEAASSNDGGVNSGPILFNYGNEDAVLGTGWKDYKTKLLDNLKDGDRMELTGSYSTSEKAPKGFANMGEARAEEARKALGIPKDRVLLKGQLSKVEFDKKDAFKAVSFKNIGKPKSIEESIDNKIIIRFPSNSTKRLTDPKIEDYLSKLAKRVKASGEKVRLVGHTDSDGPSAPNVVLGQQRADIIKGYLLKKGVPANQILSSSKGETQPVSSNSTSSGKANNRRTELEIIK